MARTPNNAKKRGRPEIDSEPVTVRLPRELLVALDEWRGDQPIAPTRPDVLRFALVGLLKKDGKLK